MRDQGTPTDTDRRTLLQTLPLASFALAAGSWPGAEVRALEGSAPRPAIPDPRLGESFPSQAPEQVREMVGVSHGNVTRVRELLAERPGLALATWDWGWGDWESALDAASHVGNREIAELLLSHGARPTLFTAAMLGQSMVVKATLEARPGLQRTRGPHGITLLSHAKAGGPGAEAVVAYLTALGDADPKFPLVDLAASEGAKLVGAYEVGPAERDRFLVSQKDGQLQIERPGGAARRLFHLGRLEFFPTGAEAVRIRFELKVDGSAELTIVDGSEQLLARRSVS